MTTVHHQQRSTYRLHRKQRSSYRFHVTYASPAAVYRPLVTSTGLPCRLSPSSNHCHVRRSSRLLSFSTSSSSWKLAMGRHTSWLAVFLPLDLRPHVPPEQTAVALPLSLPAPPPCTSLSLSFFGSTRRFIIAVGLPLFFPPPPSFSPSHDGRVRGGRE